LSPTNAARIKSDCKRLLFNFVRKIHTMNIGRQIYKKGLIFVRGIYRRPKTLLQTSENLKKLRIFAENIR